MADIPEPGGAMFRAGRPLRALRLAVLALALLALGAVQAQAAGSASVTRVFYDPPSGPLPGCVAPLPGGGGSASASYHEPNGAYDAAWEWNVPQTIAAGATGSIKASITVKTAGGAGASTALKPPFEFGANAGARQQVVAQVPVGAPGTATDQESYTFTPTRDFTDGEKLYIRIEIGCAALIYEYTGSGPAATPTAPRLSPRTTRPVPGVITSYASPRPGRVVALPFPASGCAPPVTTTAREAATPVGGECEVDVFLRRKGGAPIHDGGSVFAVDARIKDANVRLAFNVCLAYALDLNAKLGVRDNDVFAAAHQRYLACIVAVARILERADDLRARRQGTPFARGEHAAHACRGHSVRLRGQARRAVPVSIVCRHTATRTRLTLRGARRGATIGSLVRPSSTLLIGRSSSVPFRPGDRIDVLWTITPPRTTTTIRTPAPLPGAPAAATAKVALTSVEAFPNQRTSNDPPANAIDGDTSTFTWSTEAYNVVHPSYLAVGFAEANVGRLRLWKERNGGGGELIKNLTIQYTTGTGPLSSRTWATVSGLTNGIGGAELLKATAVNADGTVTGDVHDSPSGDGYASLSFTPVRATGLRIAFANPNPATTCSAVSGTCNHYRVGEVEAYAVP